MNKSNIHLDALEHIAEGVRKATEVVAKTMGPRGSNVIIQSKLYPYMITTNDGASVIKNLYIEDPIENIGLNYAKEMADRSNNNSGDGSTTSLVLLDAILQEGLKAKESPLQIKHSLDECLSIIEKSIGQQTRQITVEDIPAVARIAGEDEELAQKLGEIYRTIGKDGIIHLEGSGTYQTTYSLIEGVRFVDTGYLSPYMATDGKKAQYENPTILITKNKIEHIKDIDPLLQALIARGDKTLVIFTNDMDSNVARALIELQKNEKRTINILIIKAPTLWKQYVFEDFAACTGSTIIEDASGTSLGNKLRLDWLGTCDTLICDKEETTLIGIKDIRQHIEDLNNEAVNGNNDAKLRLSWLTTKTAILKLGAKSETELSYRRLKAEDAIFSAKLALKHGIVPGGGVALRNSAKVMPDSIGGNILREALCRPAMQIIANAGGDEGTNVFLPPNTDLSEYGFNAETRKWVKMIDVGIVDAALIVLGAVRNSLGIASTLLTTSSVITLPEEKKEAQQPFPFV